MQGDPSAKLQSERSGRRVLVLFAHPALQSSHVNRELIRGLDQVEGVTFHDLYENYPDMGIDVRREQQLLLEHDVIVMQHPFFWYSTPPILKEWQDLVLEHGWAYGKKGTALRGKVLVTAVTTGAREETYTPGQHSLLTVREFLAPIEYTARLCGMRYLAPFITHGSLGISADQIAEHRERYHRLLVALRDDQLDIEGASKPEVRRLNQELGRLIHTRVEQS